MAKEWLTVEPGVGPLLDLASPILDTIDSVLGFLIEVLNIAQAILDVIKTFMVGVIDPIRAIVEQIIAEIRALIADLRQLGVYLTGDWRLVNPEDKFSNLIGGYQAYERRMLSRLLDTADPNRPDFSSSSAVLGVFLYANSGDINELIGKIRSILKFFGQGNLMGKSAPYGTPTNPEIKFGAAGVGGATAFRQLGAIATGPSTPVPDSMSISWAMPAGSGGMQNVYAPAPKGFLIHVSTIPDGFNVLSLTPKSNNSAEIQDLPRVAAAAIDPTTNGALKLYGGVADLAAGSDSLDFSDVEESDDENAPLLVLQQDSNTPLIRPSLLQPSGTGKIPLIACTYLVKTGFIAKLGAGTQFTAAISRDMLPQHVTFKAGNDGFAEIDGDPEPSQRYWFRVRALTQDYVDALDIEKAPLADPKNVYDESDARLYRIPKFALTEAVNGVLLPTLTGTGQFTPGISTNFNAFTPASGAGVAEFPSAVQLSYMNAVKTAVALAILCRADLSESDGDFKLNTYAQGEGLKGLEGGGRDLLAHFGITPTWFRGVRPQNFRMKMRWAMQQVSSTLQEKTAPPDSVAEAVVAQAAILTDFQWSDLSTSPIVNRDSSLTVRPSGLSDAAWGALSQGQGQEYGFDGYPDKTILESLSDPDESKGVGGNPFCRMVPRKILVAEYGTVGFPAGWGKGPVRLPAFQESPSVQAQRDAAAAKPIPISIDPRWVAGEGSADNSPIIYVDPIISGQGSDAQVTRKGRVEFIRNALLNYNDGALLTAATSVLQLASASVSRPIGDTQWLTVRLLPQGLVPLDEILARVDQFLAGVLDGAEGVIDKIVAYIEAIQARINQLQALLNQIRALLSSLDTFQMPAISALVVVESGTGGLVSGLTGSENKPSDLASSYGGGVAMVAGGLPTVLLELLALLFGGAD